MKRFLRRIYNRVYPTIPFPNHQHQVQSFSQNGEDLVVDALLGCKQIGTYIDIGANDPVGLNNTKRFYDRGWSGINVEPHPIKCNLVCTARPRDITLNVGISDTTGEKPFYSINYDTLSTFNLNTANQSCIERGAYIIDTVNVPVVRLDYILNKHLGPRPIDFMSVDTEGSEMEVLKSNDWHEYRPKIIVIEVNDDPKPVLEFLDRVGYIPIMRNAENGFFVDGKVV